MDWKRLWLSPNTYVGYEHPMINELRDEANDKVCLKLDTKHKFNHVINENNHINRKKSKFQEKKDVL